MQELNEMPNLTAKAESFTSTSPTGTTIKRVQQLPIEENLLRLYGGIMNFQDRLPALLEKVEDWLNSQKEVIRFSNCPVLLPTDHEAHFIFEDAAKLSLKTEYTFRNHSGKCDQPELPVKGLKFDFMDFDDFTKIQKLLQNYIVVVTILFILKKINALPIYTKIIMIMATLILLVFKIMLLIC